MSKAGDADPWRALREQAADRCFKLGSVFFWPQEKHFLMYLGPVAQSNSHSFCVMASSQPYWDTEHNFPIVPEDFRTANPATKSRAFTKTTYFLFCQYTQHRYETGKLRELYLGAALEYRFNLKTDLSEAYGRLVTFMKAELPKVYVDEFLSDRNTPPDE